MARASLSTGQDQLALDGPTNHVTAASGTLSAGDRIAAAGPNSSLVLGPGSQFDLAAPSELTGFRRVLDHTAGNNSITLRAGTSLAVRLDASLATVQGAVNADRIKGGPAGANAIVTLGSEEESVRAGGGGLVVNVTAATERATVDGGHRTTLTLAGRYGDAVRLGTNIRNVAELDVRSDGLAVGLHGAGIAAVDLLATGTTLILGAAQQTVTDYAGGNTIRLAGPGQTLRLPYAQLVPTLAADHVEGFETGDALDINIPFGGAEQFAYDPATGWLSLTDTHNGISLKIRLPAHLPDTLTLSADQGFPSGDHGTLVTLGAPVTAAGQAPCFAAGTRVATASGLVAVEHLRPGHRLRTLNGPLRRLRWVGSRLVDPDRHANPDEITPVRILRGAFAHGLPSADVVLSPDHALFLAGVLIPVKYLVNGATVAFDNTGPVRYFHLELASHDIVLAENLPVESYLDTGNRAQFTQTAGSPAPSPANAPIGWSDQACAPLVTDGAPVRTVRAALMLRAGQLGYATTADADLHLEADGQLLWGEAAGGIWRCWAPPGTRRLRLLSRVAAPADCDLATDDRRRLGVALSRIALRSGGLCRTWNLDRAWGTGFLETEHDEWSAWRWTNGEAEFSPELWNDVDGPFCIELQLFRSLTYRLNEERPGICPELRQNQEALNPSAS